MTFHEVMQKYPQVTEVFLKNKMTCFGCVMARYETIEQGAIMHGIGVKRFVEELNKAAAKKKKK
ncbi:MAG: DUF1858 domain-containing protein [archaeon]|nr:MAG: DUF1858 domain-containing protein [archaeon]